MSNAIQVRRESTPALAQPDPSLPVGPSFDQMMSLATAIHKSGMFGHRNPESVFVSMLKGRELGVPATVALSMIHVINNKPTASGELMLSLVERDYGRGAMYIDLAECDDTKAVVRYRDPMSGEYKGYTYTIEMARTAGLLSGNNKATWERYPGNMLRWRAVSNVAKAVFPASIGGLYTPEEMGANVAIDADGNTRIVDVASAPVDDEADRERRMRYLHVAGKEVGLDHDQISEKAQEWYGVSSLREMTSDQLGRMIEQLHVLRAVPEHVQHAQRVEQMTGVSHYHPQGEMAQFYADRDAARAEDPADAVFSEIEDDDLPEIAALMDELDGAQTQKEVNAVYKRAIDAGIGAKVHRHYEKRLAELRHAG